MASLEERAYPIHIHHGLKGVDPANDNVDLEVRFDDGSRYAATFFTLDNLRSLLEKNKRTGECGSGLYFWASDMVILEKLTESSIIQTVEDLLTEGEFEVAFSRLT